jgi:hypothetical protein
VVYLTALKNLLRGILYLYIGGVHVILPRVVLDMGYREVEGIVHG